jgi:hypothetical protein
MGVLLLLRLPAGLRLALDNCTWKVTAAFKGVKFIPLGAHLLHYSLED